MLIKGADFSSLAEVEKCGGKFYDEGETDAVKILSKFGFNSARLRLWVNPYDENGESYGGGTCDLETVKGLAKRAKENGMTFMLDFHYSDFWTDPSKQTLPKAWNKLGFEELKEKVYEYTASVLKSLQKDNLTPDFIQIGNEITAGMLWQHGKLIWDENAKKHQGYDNLSELLKQGIKAAREVAPKAKIILHLEKSGNNALYREWFDEITVRGVDFDIIGVSYYPYWHGKLADAESNLKDMILRYQKDIMVVETSYAFTLDDFDLKYKPKNYTGLVVGKNIQESSMPYPFSPEGQSKFLQELYSMVLSLGGVRGLGVYYWETCWIPAKGDTWASESARNYIHETHKGDGNEWANQALFDYEGRPLPSLQTIKNIVRREK